MSAELHIAGIVVHAHPEGVRQVAKAIGGLFGAEIHAASPDGKLVVTLEAPSSGEIASRIDDIQRLDGVLSASLVYQHNEALEAMMEEVSYEDHETRVR